MWSRLRGDWARHGDRPALCSLEPATSLSYRQLDAAVATTVAALERAGIGPGSRLGVALASGPDLVVTVLAGLACEAEVVVFNTGWWPRELRPALETARPQLTVTGAELAVPPTDVGPVWRLGGDAAADPPHAARAERPPGPAPPSALVCFTAGVWGEPVAYAFDDRQLRRHWLDGEDPLDGGTSLLAGEVATASGLRCALRTLAAGGTAELAGRWAPGRLLRRLRQGGVDRLWASGPQANQLAARLRAIGGEASGGAARRGESPPTLRRLDVFGGPLHEAAAQRFALVFGASARTTYSLTEAGGAATIGAVGDGSGHAPLDVGPAAPGVVLDIVDDACRAVGPETVGDVWVGGAARGHPWRASVDATASGRGDQRNRASVDATASGRGDQRNRASVDATASGRGDQRHRASVDVSAGEHDPAARSTGDRGRWGPGGALHLIGRAADRFVVDGSEVWPQLVELALSRHPEVADVAVAPRPDPELGAVGVAVIVPRDPERPPFLDDLAATLAELPPAWRPRAEVVAERLPLTATGQVHRRMLAFEESAR